jgi:hypothetical protein
LVHKVVARFKKAWNNPEVSVSDWTIRRVIVTLILGGTAGSLAAVVIYWGEQLERGEVLAYVAAGYAGTDFIEGTMSGTLPKSTAQSGT